MNEDFRQVADGLAWVGRRSDSGFDGRGLPPVRQGDSLRRPVNNSSRAFTVP
jgi:hypothetical protein